LVREAAAAMPEALRARLEGIAPLADADREAIVAIARAAVAGLPSAPSAADRS